MTKPDEQRSVLELITNKRIVEEIISELVGEPAVLSKLEEAVSDDVGELLEEDPDFRRGVVEAASSSLSFQEQVMARIGGQANGLIELG